VVGYVHSSRQNGEIQDRAGGPAKLSMTKRSTGFTFVSLEANESQALGGGFALQPRGNWTPMKIFIGEGEQEGKFFSI
jgi:hypothetical protein